MAPSAHENGEMLADTGKEDPYMHEYELSPNISSTTAPVASTLCMSSSSILDLLSLPGDQTQTDQDLACLGSTSIFAWRLYFNRCNKLYRATLENYYSSISFCEGRVH